MLKYQRYLDQVYLIKFFKDQEGDNVELIDKLFGIEFESEVRNMDIPDEQVQIKKETNNKLMCMIDNQGNPIDTLLDGIKSAMVENLEKTSPLDGQMHLYSKIQKIAKLPSYALVQLVRFFWKKSNESAGTQATKSKILRNVSFPKVLDLYSQCSDNLKSQLDLGKEFLKKKETEKLEQDKDRFEQYKAKLEAEGKMIGDDTREIFKKFKETQIEEEIQEHDQRLYCPHGQGLDTGEYELVAVITHQGRTAESGHYVAWIHEKGDQWFKYDDALVTPVKIEDILNLRGGGDWHMAYYCIYRKLETK